MAKHEQFELSLKLLLYRPEDKKFLLLKDAHPENDFYTLLGPWDLPGGRVHPGENLIDALEREATEEIGGVTYGRAELVHSAVLTASKDPESGRRVHFFYLAPFETGEIGLSDEHSEYLWQTAEEMEKNAECQAWIKEAVVCATNHLRAQEYLNDLKRSQADFDNYKKRIANDRNELSAHLTRGVIEDLIPILDNFHSAVTHVPEGEKTSPWVTGITYIEKQFEDVLGNYGVKPIDVKPGDEFDPARHEALEHQKAEGEEENKKLKIEKVVQKGYQVGDKIVRAAKVIVK